MSVDQSLIRNKPAWITALAGMSDRETQRCFLLDSRKLCSPELVQLLYEQIVKLTRVDIRRAERLAHAAVWVARELRDDGSRALSARALGHVLFTRGKYRQALRFYEMALSVFRRLEMDVEVGRTLYGGALQTQIYLGCYDQALSWASEAREIFVRTGDRLRLARLESNMGNILYRQDRFEAALEHYGNALEEFKLQGELQDQAIALRNAAVCFISLGEFDKALSTYREARADCERIGLTLLVAEADYNIAYLHYQRGEYTRAVELYRATRKRCEKLGDPYHMALCDLDQSEMYLELNMEEEGGVMADQAVLAFHDLEMRYEEAKALTFLAVAASRRGEPKKALRFFGRARKLFKQEKNLIWTSLIDLYQAIVLYQDGQYRQSRQLCRSALAVFSTTSLESKAALCELLLARLGLQAGELNESRHLCEGALKRLDEAEAPVLCCQAYLVLGQIREARRDYKGARESYTRAHSLLEDLRSHLKGEELKIAFLKDKLEVYESLVWMCLRSSGRRGAKKRAFAYIEQAKSRSLADLIAFRSLDLPLELGSRSELLDRVRRQREELNCLYRQVELIETGPGKHAAGRSKALRDRLRSCEDAMVRTMGELRSADQRFGLLQNAGTIGLDAIQSLLPQGSKLLEYYQARGTLYACVLGRRFLEIRPLASALRVQRLLSLFQFQMSKFRLGQDYSRRFSTTLQAAADGHLAELYDALIAPVRRLLEADHLIIVPHDFLHYLPFHALGSRGRCLADEVPVSYAPSASVYHLCCSRHPPTGSESLILGIPDLDAPFILEEVQGVASILPNARIFVGPAATEERLRLHGPRARFVHIATHGLFRQDNPMFSSLRLGDSCLSLLDLYSLNLSSELVTLSGCSTGINAVVGGDELLGLVRGLLYAGTRAVLVSLWDVDDRSTTDFMKSFYHHMKLGANKARALQQAMHEVRMNYPHPYYWAPFVLIGNVHRDGWQPPRH